MCVTGPCRKCQFDAPLARATPVSVAVHHRPAVTLLRVTRQPVELHVVSDSTGETAVRLVHALEAQFPDQEFEEIRHPKVETVDDLRLTVERARGRPAVVIYTIVQPELRASMRSLCRSARLHY